jgi:hypothetical protein
LAHDGGWRVRPMSGIRRAPAFASDDWMLEQQMRAEMEAEAWRRLRQQIAQPPEPSPTPQPAAPNTHASLAPPLTPRIEVSGSVMLKALVRFALASLGAYIAWIAAMDGGLGEFEIWLATGAGFLVSLSLTMFDPVRLFVHAAAEAMRWVILVALGLGAIWLLVQMSGQH